MTEEVMMIGGGLAVLALAGGAFAFTRRRRHDEDEVLELQPAVERDGVIEAEPAFAFAGAAPVAATPIASGAETRLPNGFDLSRFGRHTQAAYRGPTAENPSLSLKKRLKRASFYDQRERMAASGQAVAPVAAAPVASVAQAARTTDHITVRPSRQPRATFRPIFNS